jgi:tetratricopeptide (TPR) repeat protein
MFNWFKKTLPPAADDGSAEAYFSRGNDYADENKLEQAIASYLQAISLKPDFFKAQFNLGNALYGQGKLDDAIACYRRVVSLQPDFFDARIALGNALQDQKKFEDAVAAFGAAVALRPDFAEAHCNLGSALAAMRRFDEALASLDTALSLKPDYADAYTNRGNVLGHWHRYQESLACHDRALQLQPGNADAHFNRANTLVALKRHEQALADFGAATQIRPDFVDAHFSEAACRLSIGDYARGWQKYEWRWRLGASRSFTQPLWLGAESLQGKTIFVYAEQGLGDTLQFCRYLKPLAQRGATVLLEAQHELGPLLSRVDGVARISARGDAPPAAFDYQCPLMSLPLAFGTTLETIPSSHPYLTALPDMVREIGLQVGARQSKLTKLNIGICWKGGPGYKRDAERSPGMAPFAKLFSIADVAIYSLVPDGRGALLEAGAKDTGYDLGASPSFEQTAALIMNLDLMITCDTSVCHLAGALGKPVWLVLPAPAPDWRWLLEREDSPWYPNTRLFRQAAPGDWLEVFDRIALRLGRVLDGSSPLVWPVASSR